MFTTEKNSALGLGNLGFADSFAFHTVWLPGEDLALYKSLEGFLVCFCFTLLLSMS